MDLQHESPRSCLRHRLLFLLLPVYLMLGFVSYEKDGRQGYTRRRTAQQTARREIWKGASWTLDNQGGFRRGRLWGLLFVINILKRASG